MNRRGFFGFLGAGAVGAAVGAPREQRPSISWTPICTNPYCGFKMKPVVINVDTAISAPNQCPRCLSVIDLSPLADLILKVKP